MPSFEFTRQRADLEHEYRKAMRRALVLIDAGELSHAEAQIKSANDFRSAINALETKRKAA
ncbi:hypothetical protein [uncultured Nitratireductor sp.]|uniref:hypothetical protein n=1 Tax=uncultured Nitratireductor sp. TaxID=520953 RepID=UPI0025D114F2|nr:hypothetical protein [uncultured Nitratireductor sp.]